MRIALASVFALWAAQAQAGFWDFLKREPKPERLEDQPWTIMGLDTVTFGLIVLAVIVVGASIYMNPRAFLREVAQGFGTLLGWILGGALALAIGAGYYYLTGSVLVLGIVIGALLLVIVFMMLRHGL